MGIKDVIPNYDELSQILVPLGEEYKLDGVTHRDYRDIKSGKEVTYYAGEDGFSHVK